MKVIFKKLEEISISDRRKDPVLVDNMEYLFDGVTIRDVTIDDYEHRNWFLYYDGDGEGDYYIHETWFKKNRGDEHKDVMKLFSMEI
jgi:hypothetical protein